MNGYITPSRYGNTLDMPVSLPQTELRRGRYMNCCQVNLKQGQTMRIRCLNLHLINILTPASVPSTFNTPLGIVSAGVYMTPMICSSPCLLSLQSPGVSSLNYFAYRDFATPGVYYFTVSNNTSNIDVSVLLTGSVKILNLNPS